jgi:hypothetical protein
VKTKTTTVFAYITIAIILASTCLLTVHSVHAAGTVSLINIADGSNIFNFTSPAKNVGDTFTVNITIANAVDVGTWQASISWNGTLITFVSISYPSDEIFAGKSPIRAPPTITVGNAIVGAAAGPGSTGFTGNGRLAQLVFNITQAVGAGETVQTDLQFTGIPSDTFILDSQGTDITGSYAFNSAHYIYSGPPGAVKVHDIAVTNVVPSATLVSQNSSLNINVTIKNNGDFSETFSVGVTANATSVDANQTVTGLAAGASTTVTFAWNTSSFATGKYLIVAAAGPVAGETNTADNTLNGPIVSVRGGGLLGDVDGNGKVDMNDIMAAIQAFGSFSGQPRYDPNADFNGDGRIDMRDILTIALNFGRHS